MSESRSAEVVTTRGNTQSDSAEMSETLLSVIARAAADPLVDVAKMEKLLEMQERIMSRNAEVAFNQALARLKPRLPRITKNGAIVLNNGSKILYAKYEEIYDAITPLLAEEGFTVSFSSDLIPNTSHLRVTATFRHDNGHQDVGSVVLPLTDDSGAKNKVQGVGSVLSYGKRYALCNYLDIVAEGEDDDGTQGGLKPITEKQQGEILDMLNDSGADQRRFLEFMNVKSIAEIMVKDFQKAMTALRKKKKEGEEKEQKRS